MKKIKVRKRIHGILRPGRTRRIDKVREGIAEELPDLIRRNQLRHDARKEKTFSGMVRRATHRVPLSPMQIAEKAEIRWADFSRFLTGEGTMPSDAIDRLGKLLKLTLQTPKRWPLEKIHFRRIYGKLTPAQMRQLRKTRKLIEAELPDLIRRHQMSCDAAEEKTISGALRRAIHTCGIMLPDLVALAEVDMDTIDDFLTGEKTLPSDTINRLVQVLKLKLATNKRKPRPRKTKAG